MPKRTRKRHTKTWLTWKIENKELVRPERVKAGDPTTAIAQRTGKNVLYTTTSDDMAFGKEGFATMLFTGSAETRQLSFVIKSRG